MEALRTYVQIHCDDMIYAGNGEQVGEHPRSDGTSMTLLLGLAGVGEVSRLCQHAHGIKQNGQHTA